MSALTPSRDGPQPAHSLSPIDIEARDVAGLSRLRRCLTELGALRLGYGLNPLVRVIGDQTAHGALSPGLAKAMLTRAARARAAKETKARRRALSRMLGITLPA